MVMIEPSCCTVAICDGVTGCGQEVIPGCVEGYVPATEGIGQLMLGIMMAGGDMLVLQRRKQQR